MQCDSRAPRPTRPRSWWSCERPNRSAFRMSIAVAFGTSTPTSTTVVAQRTSISPDRNACIAASFSGTAIAPCRSPTANSGKISWRSSSASLVAASACSDSDSSISGHTTYACLPSVICRRTNSYASCWRCDGIHVVLIGRRPGGISSSTEMSRSPYAVIASVRGMGVAVITSMSGIHPFVRSAARCLTPKRCCSSTTTRPRPWNSTPSWISACVPTVTWARPSAARACACSRSPLRSDPVSTCTATPNGASMRERTR